MTNKLDGDDTTQGKNAELSQLDIDFQTDAWKFKKKFEDEFRDALTGTMGKKTEFAARLRKEFQDRANVELKEHDELVQRAKTVYGNELRTHEKLTVPSTTEILNLEKSPILQKVVVGSRNVDIAAMIEKLSNSDWVREGLKYKAGSGDICPFCQQKTDEAFTKSLNEYFDETYLNNLDSIKVLSGTYDEYAKRLLAELEALIEAEVPFLDLAIFKPQVSVLSEKIVTNQSRLKDKLDEPSSIVNLESLNTILTTIIGMITQANDKVDKHNQLVANSTEERKKIQTEIWRYIVEDALTVIDSHNQRVHKLEKTIEGILRGKDDNEEKRLELDAKLTELEKRGTSINASISEINQTLNSFGFKGFKLAVSEVPGYYKIIRLDGQDAHESLSEGEKTFITFLYFFHLLRGSQSQAGVTTPRIAVFDDPVSSLDSEVLFIVSTLIKSVIASIVEDSPVKQVILLTHNMYFFKEVSFKSSKQVRDDRAPKLTYKYWTVAKRNEVTKIEKHNVNPIKSAYQMLWDELKQDNCSRHTIRNTLRRILEYYFTTIGSQSLDDLPAHFTGNEQSICRSLISWIHEGSHFTDDDYTVVPSLETVERQKTVFKRIFEETKHITHYEMMMGEEVNQKITVVAEVVA